jgi:hypothetical protein
MMKAFYFCVSLNAINLPVSWDAVTNVESLFAQSYSLKTIILPAQFGNITKAGSVVAYIAWKNVQNLEFVGSLTEQCDFSYFTTCFNFPILINSLVSKFSLYATVSETSDVTSVRLTNQGSLFNGANPVIGVAYSALSKDSLETLFGDIPSGLISKTIAITGCTGTDAFISKTASGTTINSTTITMANTSSLVAGMEVYGTGISTAKAVTFTDTGDLVNRTAHGLSNGMKISFSSITSTTGIVVNTPYYVINASANTFQVSLTLGGSAIALTTNGSGNLIAIPTIVMINENVSIVIDVPCSATASVTLTAGILKRSIALLKGWTITN